MSTRIIAWTTGSGNITLTYLGQGNGSIQVDSDANTLGTERSQTITVKTGQGGVVTKNLTVKQGACPFPVGEVRGYSYTGSYQEVELPAGRYKLQCWGAQGGSNAAASSYGITAQSGGKGGYSEGVITLSQKTIVRVYVGGVGSTSAGGFNGGGSTTGASTYNANNEQGVSRMGGGGGATDIRLVDGSLYSRMIVAGGGSGGAMCYKKNTSPVTITIPKSTFPSTRFTMWTSGGITYWGENEEGSWGSYVIDVSAYRGYNCSFTVNTYTSWAFSKNAPENDQAVIFAGSQTSQYYTSSCNQVIPSDATYLYINYGINKARVPSDLTLTTTSTTEVTVSQIGYVGGGTVGGGYGISYPGKQNTAGANGLFGQGANQDATSIRYASAAGGGGWYGGGGGEHIHTNPDVIKYSGGGSGWVNIAANAGNRPSGYTGLELDSGSTIAGDQSFEAPGGGTETGHEGNGYARITRLS